MSIDLVRDTAVRVLLRVFEDGAFLDSALDRALRRRNITDRGRRFLTQVVYGTVRHRLLCDHILGKLVHEPLDKLPLPILVVLRMGVFQALYCSQVTFPAMVHTSVDLARAHGHAGTARLVNAVLRRAPQSLDAVRLPNREKYAVEHLSLRYSFPRWLVREWIDEYGDATAEALCAAMDTPAPTSLRANTLRTSREELSALLARAGAVVEMRTSIPEEITLTEGGLPPARSKLFDDGHFLIQDPASMLPPHLLQPQPGDLVLDLCAAPGGKATHLAQLSDGKALVVAADLSDGRLRYVRENVERLEIPGVLTVCADGLRAPFGQQFDKVLVDAPCSGLGTLRRHPDLKWRLTPEGRHELAATQAALLREAVRLCKNGGLVVYSVCTFSREETVDVVRGIVAEGTVEPEDGPEWLAPWKIETGQYRTLPTNGELDGFFLTRLRRVS